MNQQDLINKILSEVKLKLDEQNIKVECNKNCSENNIINVMSMKNNKTAIITYSPFQNDILNTKKILESDNITANYINDIETFNIAEIDYLIVPYLSNDMLFNIANGIQKNCPTLKTIAEFFLQNKMVYFINDGVDIFKFKHTSNVKYYNNICSNVDMISSFCCKFVNANNLIENIDKKATYHSSHIQKNENLSKSKKKLITEKDILELKQSGKTQISLEKNTIITQLAKDTAKRLCIEIIK